MNNIKQIINRPMNYCIHAIMLIPGLICGKMYGEYKKELELVEEYKHIHIKCVESLKNRTEDLYSKSLVGEEFYQIAYNDKGDNIRDVDTRKWYAMALDREPNNYNEYRLVLRDVDDEMND